MSRTSNSRILEGALPFLVFLAVAAMAAQDERGRIGGGSQPFAEEPDFDSAGELDAASRPGGGVGILPGGVAGGTPKEAAPGRSSEQPEGSQNQLLKLGIGTLKSLLGGSPELPADKQMADENQGRVDEHKRLALSDFEKNRITGAIRNINELITLRPYEANFHFALGLCYRREGQYKEAMKKYQDVLDLGGPKAVISLLKAEVYATEGKKDKVFEMLKEAAMAGRNIINDVQNLPLLAKFQSDTEFIKLALQLERFELQRGRRLDPFTNLFPKAQPLTLRDPSKASGEIERPLDPREQDEILRSAKKLFERIQFYIKLQDEEKAMSSYLQLKEHVAKQKLLTVPKIVNEFRMLVQRIPDLEVEISGIRLKYYYNQAQGMLQTMKEVFDDGDYVRVETLHAQLEGLGREMVSANEKYRQVADQILERSRRWVERARVRLAFESQKPEIQGIIIAGDEKMAILNHRIVKQGENLADLRVVKVESNRITFKYRGEEIPMVFRRY
jgi:tetratricopeptide (TPR) repeat protein